MHTTRETASLFSVSVVSFALAALLCTGGSARAQAGISNEQTVGTYAYAFFVFPGTTACNSMMVTVSGSFSVVKTGATTPAAAKPTSTLEAFYLLWDHCEGAALSSAYGSAQLPGTAGMHVKPSLTGASMHSALFSADGQTEALIPTTIDVVWTGVGDISRQSATGHHAGEDYFYNQRYISAAREATASGTVTFGSTTYDVTQAVRASAYIGTINSGLVVGQ